MRIFSTYSAKIKNYNHIFKKTVSVYREAVDFMIQVCLQKWKDIRKEDYLCSPVIYVERLCHRTKQNPEVPYESFDRKFYKLPSYLRRSAISDAIGKVSSYKSNLKNWKEEVVRMPGYLTSETIAQIESTAATVNALLIRKKVDYIVSLINDLNAEERKELLKSLSQN